MNNIELPVVTYDDEGNVLMGGKRLDSNSGSVKLIKEANTDIAQLYVEYLVRVDTKKPQ